MPTPTAEMDDWIHQLYGKHPDDFMPPGQRRRTASAADMPGAPPVGPAAAPPGHSPTPPAPPAPPTPVQWSANNKAAMDKMNDASSRVVMQAPALAAQARVQAALQAINTALAAGNTNAASAALFPALGDANLVMAQPDAAMGQVHKGQHPDQVLFGKETPNANHAGAADTQDIQPSDINQDGVGDCWLLSTLGEVARIKPDVIRNMIKDNKDGTYTVTLFRHKGGISGFFAGVFGGNDLEPVKVTVDSDFGSNTVNSQPQQAQVGNQHEIWVQVVEKAFAKLNGGYDKITHGGWPMDAMEAVTGKKAEKKPVAKLTVEELADDLAKGKPVVMDTMPQPNPNTLLPFGMYGPHAYMVDSIVGKGPNAVVILKNPWGNRHPLPIPFSQLGQSISVVDTGGAL